MTNFLDKFNRANEASINGNNGWVVLKESGTGDIELTETYVHNATIVKAAFAYQTGTLPETHEQEVRVKYVVKNDNLNAYIGIGTHGGPDGSSNPDFGFGCLIHNNSGVRTLSLIKNDQTTSGFGTGYDIIVSKTVTVAAEELLADSAGQDLGVIQQMRFRIKAVPGGTRLRCYINEDKNDEPTLEWYEKTEPYGTSYGSVWFYFGGSSVIDSLLIGEFEAFDTYPESDPRELEGRLTLKDITDGARNRYAGSSRDDFDETLAQDYANDAQAEVLSQLGDMAYFLDVTEDFVLTADADYYTELQTKIGRVLSIRNPNTERAVRWEATGYTTKGNLRVKIDPVPSGNEYRINYILRPERMTTTNSISVIPKDHGEILKLSVAMRMAQFDSNMEHYMMLREHYERLLKLLRRKCNLWHRQRKLSRFHSNRRQTIRKRYESDTIDQWGY